MTSSTAAPSPWIAEKLPQQVLVVLLVGGLVLGVAAWYGLDLAVTAWFYDSVGEQPFPWGDHAVIDAIDTYGEIPGVLILILATVVVLLARARPRLAPHRDTSFQLVCLTLLGPGLLVHGLKLVWGRSRPRDVLHWLRPEPYREWWQPGGLDVGTSFPSGHVAIAVVVVIATSVALRGSAWRPLGLALAVLFVAAVMLSRIADGAHYFTDAVWSCLLVTLTWFAVRAWSARRAAGTRARPQHD